MDVSELRKLILRSIDDARKEAAKQRVVVDEAAKAYEVFLADIAVPLMQQAAHVLSATGEAFDVHTPAGSVRLVSGSAPQTFFELELDREGTRTALVGRISLTRGRQGVIIDEKVVAGGKSVVDLTEGDLSTFIVAEIPKLLLKR